MSETHEFKMHPKMLLDIIERQAGTLEKAVLEATMNAAEAGSPDFRIDFEVAGDHRRLVMTDSGRGIKTKRELEEHFKTFGTPHEASEGKKWAQFRMGRGQCFAQGKNVWRTCGWMMTTDIRADVKADRLPSFELVKADEEFNGCQIAIDLYYDKCNLTVEALKARVKEQIEFVDMDVYFNGDKINRSPETIKTWTETDDDAYYLFGKGNKLTIYNMGVRVCDIPASISGCVGVVISKQQLKVNFARNEVLTDCPVMNRINRIIKKYRVTKTRKSQRRLNRDDRTAALADLRDGIQDFDSLKSIGLFFTTSGRSLTFRDIMNNRLPWSFAPEGNMVADKLMQRGAALVIDESAMDELGYSGDPTMFFAWLTRSSYGVEAKWKATIILYRPFDQLRENFSETHTILPREKWTKKEKRLIRVLEGFNCWGGRALSIGLSDSANAWTDGQTYTCLGREFVQSCNLGNHGGAAKLFAVMVHEMAHDDSTIGTHVHGEQFYRNFHNLIRYGNVDGCSDIWTEGGAYRYLDTFVARMKNAIIQERDDEAVRREEKAAAQVAEALVVTADSRNSPPKTKITRVARIAAAPKKKKRPGMRRRLPTGAM